MAAAVDPITESPQAIAVASAHKSFAGAGSGHVNSKVPTVELHAASKAVNSIVTESPLS